MEEQVNEPVVKITVRENASYLVEGPVKIVDAPKSKKDPVLVVTEIDVQGDKATVRYRYDIEGIRGTVTLAKSPHGWELKNSRVVEH